MASKKKEGMRRRGKLAKGKKGIDQGNVKVLANPMRVQVQTICNERPSSATGMAKELGADFSEINYEVEVLRKLGRLEVAKEVKRRGAVEIFYRATSRAMFDEYEWPMVPDAVKGDLRASLLQTLTDDAVTAITEGTYDSRERAHMSWTPVILDEEGWEELADVLTRALKDTLAIHEKSAERLYAKDAKGISCTVSILGYPSAVEDRKVGPPRGVSDLKVLPGRETKDGRASEGKVKKRGTGKVKGKASGSSAKTKKAKGSSKRKASKKSATAKTVTNRKRGK
jgi:hypothetical protein